MKSFIDSLLAGFFLALTMGAMLEAVPSTGFEGVAWTFLAILSASLFVHFHKKGTP